jgi:hypothetical protein
VSGCSALPAKATRRLDAVLTGLVGKAPELDLLIFQRLSALSAA